MICPPVSRCESLNAKRHIICTCFLSSQMVLTVVKIRMKTDCAVFHLSLCVCSAEKLLSLWFLGILTVTQSLIFHLAFSWIEFEWCCNMFLYCIHSSKGKKHHVPLERGWLKFLCLDYTHTYQCGCWCFSTCAHYSVSLACDSGSAVMLCVYVYCVCCYIACFVSFVQLMVKSLLKRKKGKKSIFLLLLGLGTVHILTGTVPIFFF